MGAQWREDVTERTRGVRPLSAMWGSDGLRTASERQVPDSRDQRDGSGRTSTTPEAQCKSLFMSSREGRGEGLIFFFKEISKIWKCCSDWWLKVQLMNLGGSVLYRVWWLGYFIRYKYWAERRPCAVARYKAWCFAKWSRFCFVWKCNDRENQRGKLAWRRCWLEIVKFC